MSLRRSVFIAAALGGALSVAPLALAQPVFVDDLWDPYFGNHTKAEGYLEFINPTEHPGLIGTPVPSSPPGLIQTEEYTGYTLADGTDVIEIGDSDISAGDRADFDWVQENRPCETGGACNNALPVNHPNQVGAMGWTVGQTEGSAHVDPGTGAAHGHSDEETPPGTLPHLVNNDYALPFFNAVDVFPIISVGQDGRVDPSDPSTLQAGGLDYVLDFANTQTGAFSTGVLTVVWVPGWTNVTYIDDYVARWVPLNPGVYDIVAIEPTNGGIAGGYEAVEIDAIKALFLPEPLSFALMGLGLAVMGFMRRK